VERIAIIYNAYSLDYFYDTIAERACMLVAQGVHGCQYAFILSVDEVSEKVAHEGRL
jgi:hypothetical protein